MPAAQLRQGYRGQVEQHGLAVAAAEQHPEEDPHDDDQRPQREVEAEAQCPGCVGASGEHGDRRDQHDEHQHPGVRRPGRRRGQAQRPHPPRDRVQVARQPPTATGGRRPGGCRGGGGAGLRWEPRTIYSLRRRAMRTAEAASPAAQRPPTASMAASVPLRPSLSALIGATNSPPATTSSSSSVTSGSSVDSSPSRASFARLRSLSVDFSSLPSLPPCRPCRPSSRPGRPPSCAPTSSRSVLVGRAALLRRLRRDTAARARGRTAARCRAGRRRRFRAGLRLGLRLRLRLRLACRPGGRGTRSRLRRAALEAPPDGAALGGRLRRGALAGVGPVARAVGPEQSPVEVLRGRALAGLLAGARLALDAAHERLALGVLPVDSCRVHHRHRALAGATGGAPELRVAPERTEVDHDGHPRARCTPAAGGERRSRCADRQRDADAQQKRSSGQQHPCPQRRTPTSRSSVSLRGAHDSWSSAGAAWAVDRRHW